MRTREPRSIALCLAWLAAIGLWFGQSLHEVLKNSPALPVAAVVLNTVLLVLTLGELKAAISKKIRERRQPESAAQVSEVL